MGRYSMPYEVLELTGIMDKNKKAYEHFKKRKVETMTKKPVCPKKFSKETRKAWDCWVGWLIYARVIQESDYPALLALAETYEAYRKCQNSLEEFDKTFDPLDPAQIKARCQLQTSTLNCLKSFMSLADRYGLTPSYRARIEIPNEDTSKGDIDELYD